MSEISTDKNSRYQQFRAIARGILASARGPGAITDRVGEFARAMEIAYSAGAQNVGKEDLPADSFGYIEWDRIPRRSQELLQEIAFLARDHLALLRLGEVTGVVYGAGQTAPRGARAEIGLCRFENGEWRELQVSPSRDWAASSASALVRSGILLPLDTSREHGPAAYLSKLGRTTIGVAIDNGHIYIPQ